MKMGKIIGYLILTATLIFLYGLSILSLLFTSPAIDFSASLLISSLLINTVILCGSSILGNMLFYSSNLYTSLKNLYFTKKNIGYSIFIGSSSAFIILFFLGLIFYIFIQIGYTPPDNPLSENIAEALTLPLVIVIPLLSSISEEIFFRGFIQPKLMGLTTPIIGIVITSFLFGFAHLAYNNPLQIVIPFFIGLIFGFLLIKTKNILAPISAHFFFNFIQLALTYFSQ